jgi:hypothetical protein
MFRTVRMMIFAMIIFAVTAMVSISYAGTVDLPQTGQTICYDASGNVIACENTGQDGDWPAGIAWPSPRFTDHYNGTITDNLTGLVWLRNANCYGLQTWANALNTANALNSGECGLSDGSVQGDWRLPNINELESLIHAGHAGNENPATWLNSQGFSNVNSNLYQWYWSSTTDAFVTGRAWVVYMDSGSVGVVASKTYLSYGWPVRSASPPLVSPPPADLWKTGQSICYDASGNVIACENTGQDGDWQAGIAWPSPRFTDKGNGTVTDNLTGLVWLKDANCFEVQNWTNALNKANALNSGECGLSDGSVEGDWRLPNRKELRSLVDYSQNHSQNKPSLPADSPFTNVQSNSSQGYWSSTTSPTTNSTGSAWVVGISLGYVYAINKDSSYSVWPVRSRRGPGSFSDVPPDYWAHNYIVAIYGAQITAGCSTDPLEYCPEASVTREQMAVFIIRALNQVPADGYCGSAGVFSDVPADRWSCKYVKRLVELGITSGVGGGLFDPEGTVTREQMAAFITRALDEVPADGYCGAEDPFTDVTYSWWSCKYVKRLVELGITVGIGEGLYGPGNPVTRAQMAVFLSRAFLGM